MDRSATSTPLSRSTSSTSGKEALQDTLEKLQVRSTASSGSRIGGINLRRKSRGKNKNSSFSGLLGERVLGDEQHSRRRSNSPFGRPKTSSIDSKEYSWTPRSPEVKRRDKAFTWLLKQKESKIPEIFGKNLIAAFKAGWIGTSLLHGETTDDNAWETVKSILARRLEQREYEEDSKVFVVLSDQCVGIVKNREKKKVVNDESLLVQREAPQNVRMVMTEHDDDDGLLLAYVTANPLFQFNHIHVFGMKRYADGIALVTSLERFCDLQGAKGPRSRLVQKDEKDRTNSMSSSTSSLSPNLHTNSSDTPQVFMMHYLGTAAVATPMWWEKIRGNNRGPKVFQLEVDSKSIEQKFESVREYYTQQLLNLDSVDADFGAEVAMMVSSRKVEVYRTLTQELITKLLPHDIVEIRLFDLPQTLTSTRSTSSLSSPSPPTSPGHHVLPQRMNLSPQQRVAVMTNVKDGPKNLSVDEAVDAVLATHKSNNEVNEQLLCLYHHDTKLNTHRIETILCTGGTAQSLMDAIIEARKAAEERQNDPFFVNEDDKPQFGDATKQWLEDVELDRDQLTAVEELGAGEFGTVYLANRVTSSTVVDGIPEDEEIVQAVKTLKPNSTKQYVKAFVQEAKLHSQLKHDNIVELVGVCFLQKPLLVVLDYCMYGDLRKVLKACKEKEISLTELEQAHIARQVSSALDYVHQQRIVHLDLATRNVLVHTNSQIKVADFGLARRYSPGCDHWAMKGRLKIPFMWQPPESLPTKVWDDTVRDYNPIFNETTDVWSFGVLLWEMLTYGDVPYNYQTDIKPLLKKIYEGQRLQFPASTPNFFREISSKCFSNDPTHRPKFAEITQTLDSIIQTKNNTNANANTNTNITNTNHVHSSITITNDDSNTTINNTTSNNNNNTNNTTNNNNNIIITSKNNNNNNNIRDLGKLLNAPLEEEMQLLQRHVSNIRRTSHINLMSMPTTPTFGTPFRSPSGTRNQSVLEEEEDVLNDDNNNNNNNNNINNNTNNDDTPTPARTHKLNDSNLTPRPVSAGLVTPQTSLGKQRSMMFFNADDWTLGGGGKLIRQKSTLTARIGSSAPSPFRRASSAIIGLTDPDLPSPHDASRQLSRRNSIRFVFDDHEDDHDRTQHDHDHTQHEPPIMSFNEQVADKLRRSSTEISFPEEVDPEDVDDGVAVMRLPRASNVEKPTELIGDADLSKSPEYIAREQEEDVFEQIASSGGLVQALGFGETPEKVFERSVNVEGFEVMAQSPSRRLSKILPLSQISIAQPDSEDSFAAGRGLWRRLSRTQLSTALQDSDDDDDDDDDNSNNTNNNNDNNNNNNDNHNDNNDNENRNDNDNRNDNNGDNNVIAEHGGDNNTNNDGINGGEFTYSSNNENNDNNNVNNINITPTNDNNNIPDSPRVIVEEEEEEEEEEKEEEDEEVEEEEEEEEEDEDHEDAYVVVCTNTDVKEEGNDNNITVNNTTNNNNTNNNKNNNNANKDDNNNTITNNIINNTTTNNTNNNNNIIIVNAIPNSTNTTTTKNVITTNNVNTANNTNTNNTINTNTNNTNNTTNNNSNNNTNTNTTTTTAVVTNVAEGVDGSVTNVNTSDTNVVEPTASVSSIRASFEKHDLDSWVTKPTPTSTPPPMSTTTPMTSTPPTPTTTTTPTPTATQTTTPTTTTTSPSTTARTTSTSTTTTTPTTPSTTTPMEVNTNPPDESSKTAQDLAKATGDLAKKAEELAEILKEERRKKRFEHLRFLAGEIPK